MLEGKYDIAGIVRCFDVRGRFAGARSWGSGHINDTYRVEVEQGGCIVPYILQRINTNVFKDPVMLMDNVARVTAHIRRRLESRPDADPTRQGMTLIPTLDGASYLSCDDGTCWRMYIFILKANVYDQVASPQQAFEAARAFGAFQAMLRDLPGPPLGEVIPNFHNTPWRFANLQRAVEADTMNRAAQCRPEIEFALSRQSMTGLVVEKLSNGELPSRVTHNDTKINNVLFDEATGKGLCVIDLDTVMPGSVLYDFGDEIRTTTVSAAEDERDLSKVVVRRDLLDSLVAGYLESAGDFLTPAERELLVFSGRLITFEIGLRFLTDFLEGDVYFKVHRDGHNLDRCRTQFEMVRQLETM